MSSEFDYKKSKEIIDAYLKQNYRIALEKADDYVLKYPNDQQIYSNYVNLLCMYNRYDEAYDFLKQHREEFEQEKVLHYHYIRSLICYYSYTKNYDEAFDTFLAYQDLIKEGQWKYLYLVMYLKSRLNLINDIDRERHKDHYGILQMYDYKEDRLIEMIEEYHKITDNEEQKTDDLFYPEINIKKLIDVVKSHLDEMEYISYKGFEKEYMIKCSGIGKYRWKNVDYLSVKTLHDTNEITTIRPIILNSNYESTYDITDEISQDKIKTKRLSQTEKFNRRYN